LKKYNAARLFDTSACTGQGVASAVYDAIEITARLGVSSDETSLQDQEEAEIPLCGC
jgi:hypothetical protein